MMKKSIVLIIPFFVLLFYPFVQAEAQEDKNIPIIDNVKPDPALSAPLLDLNTYYLFDPVFSSNPDLLKFSPFYLNHSLSESYKLLNKLYITPYNTKVMHLGLGRYHNIGATLKWVPVRRFSLEAGAFTSLQYGYVLSSRHKSTGYNGKLKFDINHQLFLSIYGQYMVEYNKDPFLDHSNQFPKTSVGMSLDYQPKDKTKIGIGVEYKYDQQNQKWKPETGGKVSLDF